MSRKEFKKANYLPESGKKDKNLSPHEFIPAKLDYEEKMKRIMESPKL